MIAQYPLIPEQAFLYFPQQNRIIQQRNGIRHRILFQGGLEYETQQKKKINVLRRYIKKQEQKTGIDQFPDHLLYRFLQAASFDYSDCIKTLETYQKYQAKQIVLNEKSQRLVRYLRQGTIYFCGRDYHFRPIIIVDIKKLIDIEIKQIELLDTLSFFFQYLIDNCLIEGQVQTWNTIVDVGECSIFSLGKTLIGIIKHLSSTFKARSNHTYLLGCPTSMNFLWKMVKNVLNQDQLRKITMTDKKILKQEDFVKINKNQIESKYGGNRPNIKNYWYIFQQQRPIQIDPYEFKVQNLIVNLISQQEYQKKFSKGELQYRKVKSLLVSNARMLSVLKVQSSNQKNNEQLLTTRTNVNNHSYVSEEQFLYPEEKRPKMPVVVESSFSFQDLFS